MFSRSAGRERPARHRVQPDVGVEADLVRGMASQHRAAARLRDVADQQTRPAVLRRRVARQFLDHRDHGRMAPAAVARQAHGLPGRPVDRNRDAAREAALGIEAIGFCRHRSRQLFVAEQVLGKLLRTGPRRLDARHGESRNRNGRKPQRGSEENLHGLSQLFYCPNPGPRWLPDRKRRPPLPLTIALSRNGFDHDLLHRASRVAFALARSSRRPPTLRRRPNGSPDSGNDSRPP